MPENSSNSSTMNTELKRKLPFLALVFQTAAGILHLVYKHHRYNTTTHHSNGCFSGQSGSGVENKSKKKSKLRQTCAGLCAVA